MILLVLPIMISADTYKEEVKNANELINQDFYINT